MIAPKLKEGDHLRVIAPAEGFFPKFTPELRKRAVERMAKLGLKVSFGKHVDELDDFDTTSVENRLEDLHDAFLDPSVQAIISANGGASANQLLKHIDYDLIKNNPKIFCGLSDLTELTTAIYTKTGLVTYYGPHFTSLGASELVEHSLDSMKRTFFSEESFALYPSKHYSNTQWEKEKIVNEGFWTINEGEAEDLCIGGNFLTFNFMLKTEFFPGMQEAILYLEENKIIDYKGVQKQLQEVLNHAGSEKIKGIIIGRFQRETGMNRDLLTQMIKSKKELEGIPVVGNVDVSHTVPMTTFPEGGRVKLKAGPNDDIEIIMKEF